MVLPNMTYRLTTETMTCCSNIHLQRALHTLQHDSDMFSTAGAWSPEVLQDASKRHGFVLSGAFNPSIIHLLKMYF